MSSSSSSSSSSGSISSSSSATSSSSSPSSSSSSSNVGPGLCKFVYQDGVFVPTELELYHCSTGYMAVEPQEPDPIDGAPYFGTCVPIGDEGPPDDSGFAEGRRKRYGKSKK